MILVMPMAGRGSRMQAQGYDLPKPLIPIEGKPMFWWALQGLHEIEFSKMIFIGLAEHETRCSLTEQICMHVGADAFVLLLEGVTEGQLSTILKAREHIDTHEDILIASSDTYVTSSIGRDIQSKSALCAGLISVKDLAGDKWSFARVDEQGNVVEVAEKKRISKWASTGFYYFSNGSEFVSHADELCVSEEKTGGEYYVIPVYQKYVLNGKHIGISIADEVWDMGTPESLQQFSEHLLSQSRNTNSLNRVGA